MSRLLNYSEFVGKKYGRLKIASFVDPVLYPGLCVCKCDCGNEVQKLVYNLKSGGTKSCGCRSGNTKHGGRGTRTYRVWKHMKNRCLNPKNQDFKNYGGRGIVVCDEWKSSFPSFLRDMGECPPWFSIERKDVNGNYCPGNCEWIPVERQSKNRRCAIRLTINNETKLMTEWCDVFSVSRDVVYARMRKGWLIENLFKPARATRPRLVLLAAVFIINALMGLTSSGSFIHWVSGLPA